MLKSTTINRQPTEQTPPMSIALATRAAPPAPAVTIAYRDNPHEIAGFADLADVPADAARQAVRRLREWVGRDRALTRS
jgi:hypothetical protein